MLFGSFAYMLIFLPVVVLGSILLRKIFSSVVAQGWILAASIYFYGGSRPSNLFFLGASVIANWLFARWIVRSVQPLKKRLLVVALSLNIFYLSAFKYVPFLASMFSFALPSGFVAPHIAFVLGISFFTITQIMYLVDCYEDTLTPGSLFDHATFVTFFPYVISGPLGRAKRIRHQFGNFGGLDGNRATTFARGIFLFAFGLVKKACFADSFAQVVSFGRIGATNPSAVESWVFSIAYAMQLYFDFSGYSDMAIGSALMLGIEIPRNFDAPYSSTSIAEFWQRWHISLTNFITSYLYTPIYKSFKNRTLWTSLFATAIAMTIAGIWHGAGWNFAIYGLLHGIYLGVNQAWRRNKFPAIPKFPSWLLTFVAVLISFVYFGADSVREANIRVASMFNPHHAFSTTNLSSLALLVNGVALRFAGYPLLVGVLIAFLGPSSDQRARDFKPSVLNLVYTVFFLLAGFFMVNSVVSAPFVYFKF